MSVTYFEMHGQLDGFTRNKCGKEMGSKFIDVQCKILLAFPYLGKPL